MKHLSCREAGLNCDYVIEGQTDDEVLQRAAEHGRQAHGMGEINMEMKNKLRRLIRSD